jgi:hypothetical protein
MLVGDLAEFIIFHSLEEGVSVERDMKRAISSIEIFLYKIPDFDYLHKCACSMFFGG